MSEKMRPALIGGVLLGVLSAIPVINLANICCCLWAVIGGLIASYLYIKRSAGPVSPGDGALVGLWAGAIGAVIYLVLGIPLSLIFRETLNLFFVRLMSNVDPMQAELLRQQIEAQSRSFGETLLLSTLFALIGAIILAIFSVLGGLIAVPLFEERRAPAGPPSSPQ